VPTPLPYVAVFAGGVLTILSPCILPVLPFVFATRAAGRSGRARRARRASARSSPLLGRDWWSRSRRPPPPAPWAPRGWRARRSGGGGSRSSPWGPPGWPCSRPPRPRGPHARPSGSARASRAGSTARRLRRVARSCSARPPGCSGPRAPDRSSPWSWRVPPPAGAPASPPRCSPPSAWARRSRSPWRSRPAAGCWARLRRAAGSSGEVWVRRGLGAAALATALLLALGYDARVFAGAGLVQTAGAEEVVLRRLVPDRAGAARALGTVRRPPRRRAARSHARRGPAPVVRRRHRLAQHARRAPRSPPRRCAAGSSW
jgi:hypothetical protein